jgi:hypothetical protein
MIARMSGSPRTRWRGSGCNQIAEEIERVGAQADGGDDDTRDDLDEERPNIQAQHHPRDAAVALAGFCGSAVVIATAHRHDLACNQLNSNDCISGGTAVI